ncbi:MAG TPA: RNA methyltransferase [Bacteroidales bacterium]|nr:RNA methyltransferase [Bacteroidales bacterium]
MIEEKVSSRTRYFSVLLEDVYQSKNISAVLRTAECMGLQNVHIVENKNTFEYNPYVTRGADKWLTLRRYNEQKENSTAAIKKLKSEGYRIVATSPNINGYSPDSFDISKGKFIVAFGTEWEGLSSTILNEADEHIRIPMVGCTESLNLSASAAIVIYTLCARLRNSQINWQLNDEDTNEVKLQWLQAMVHKSELLTKEYLGRERRDNDLM